MSSSRTDRRRSLLLLLLLALQACAPAQISRRGWVPEDGPEKALLLSRAGLEVFGDITAEARIAFRQGRTRRTATASVLYRSPDLFRLDVRGPLYRHLLSLLARGESVTVMSGGRTWHGDGTSALLAHLTDFELGDYDVRDALLGIVRPPPAAGSAPGTDRVSYPRADRALVRVREGSATERIIWVDLQRGLVSKERLVRHGRTVWTRELKDYAELLTAAGPVYLPRTIIFEQGELGIELDYRSYRIDTGQSAETMQAGIPAAPE